MDSSAYAKMFEIEDTLWWYQGRRKVCFGLLERYLGSRADLNILDVGCGTGYNLPLLNRFGRSQGVDMAPEALDFCRRRGVGPVTLHQAGELPFEEESFDLLTAFDVLEHIEDDRAALAEFGRILRPEGWLLIYTPALPWLYNEHDRIVHHKRRYMRSELREKLLGAGFEIEHLCYVNLLVLPLVLLARGLAKLGPAGHHQEMSIPSKPVNGLVKALCYAEVPLVQRSLLPIGMTLAALARKPSA